MNYFRKFGDLCSAIGAVGALIFLFRQFMPFKPEGEDVATMEKLKQFFSKETGANNRLWLYLVLFFVLSAIVGRIFAKLPQLATVATLPPLLLLMDGIRGKVFNEYPMFYVCLAAVAFLSCAAECVMRDGEDSKRRAPIGADIVSLCGAALCAFIYYRHNEIKDVENALELNFFDRQMFNEMETSNMEFILFLAIFFAVCAIVSLLLQDVYFIDAILALVPFISTVYMWYSDKHTAQAEMLITVSAALLIFRLMITFSKKQIKIYKKA